MVIPKNADLGFVVNHIKKEGFLVTRSMRKLLEYFQKNYVVTFTPSGFNSGYIDKYRFIAKQTGMRKETVMVNVQRLENCGVIGTQKGIKSIGGREWEYGFTPLVERLYF